MLAECVACRQRMAITEGHLGQQVSCPSCGVPVQVVDVVPTLAVAHAQARVAQPVHATPPAAGGGSALVHRCPRCRAEVEHGNFLCPRCGINIKRAKRRH